MNTMKRLLLAVLTALILVACNTTPTKQDKGVVIGAVAGGILGSQVGGGSGRVLATIVGTAAGAMIGGAVGKSMDETDQLHSTAALESVRTGVPSAWVNPDTGNQYIMTPTRTYDSGAGPCREYTLEATVGGRNEQIYGTACRQADGSWQVVG